MKKHSITALILAFLMIIPSLASCAEQSSSEEEATPPTADPTETVETEEEVVNPRLLIADDLPEADFGGRDFIVLTNSQDYSEFIYVEELNGEGVNDSVFNRNVTLQDRYNASVKTSCTGDFLLACDTITQTVQAGDHNAFQLIACHVISLGGLVSQGCFMNWYDFDYVDFSKPWWLKSNTEDLTVDNCCFLAVGDAAVSAIAATYSVFYDKDAAEKYNLENMYDVVKEGRWTSDYLINVASQAYVDTNGNGVEDDADYFGFATDLRSNVNAYLWSFGGKIMNRNADGTLEFVYFNEHLVDIFDKVIEIVCNTPGVYTGNEHADGGALFNKGKTLFANGTLGYTTSIFPDFDGIYGILPYPKYDENQAEYYSNVDGGHDALAVAKNIIDTDFVGIMTEAMCAEAYKQIVPAYYDVCLKQRYASSPEDAEMIELCVDSRIFDFGYIYDNWKGVSYFIEQMVPSGQNTIASRFKTGQKMYSNYYNKVVEQFGAYGD